jgi:hypothetical protein
MNIKKPKHIEDDVWMQHLRWMEVIDSELRANRLKRENTSRKDGRLVNY